MRGRINDLNLSNLSRRQATQDGVAFGNYERARATRDEMVAKAFETAGKLAVAGREADISVLQKDRVVYSGKIPVMQSLSGWSLDRVSGRVVMPTGPSGVRTGILIGTLLAVNGSIYKVGYRLSGDEDPFTAVTHGNLSFVDPNYIDRIDPLRTPPPEVMPGTPATSYLSSRFLMSHVQRVVSEQTDQGLMRDCDELLAMYEVATPL